MAQTPDTLKIPLAIQDIHDTHQGAEIDLVLRRGERPYGVECTHADAPRVSPSMRIALENVGLEHIAVVYPGDRRYPIADRIEAVPLRELATPAGLFGKAGL